MLIDIRQPGWAGCALAFLALCKVGFVSGFCVPCNVLKIAWGRVVQSHVSLNLSRMLFRVTHNGQGLPKYGN